MEAEAKEARRALIADVLSEYPPKTAKKRGKHLNVYEEGDSDCGVKSNIKSIPGVMTVRGCAYAGAKGVVWGPIKDIVHVSHGPVGCGQYSWGQRRNYVSGAVTGVNSWVAMQVTSNFQEKDIVFGGDKKLAKLIDEIESIFPLEPRHLGHERVPGRPDRRRHRGGRQTQERGNRQGDRSGALRRLPRRVAVARPSHRQRRDARLHRRQDRRQAVRRHAVRRVDRRRLQHRRRRLGEPHSHRGDGLARHRPMVRRRLGGGGRTRREGQAQPHPLLPLDELHLPAHGGEVRDPVDRVQLLRPQSDREEPARDRRAVRRHDQGGRRAGDRQVPAARRRGAGEIQAAPRGQEDHAVCRRVAAAPRLRRLRRSRHGSDRHRVRIRARRRLPTHDEYIKDGTLVYDDASEFELEKFIQNIRPDLVGSGIKEKYGTQKLGVPFRQMHSWDYSGPYHGYDGFAVFARDMDLAINNPVWGMHKAPWKTA
jgi:hypothetical protein